MYILYNPARYVICGRRASEYLPIAYRHRAATLSPYVLSLYASLL